LRAPACIRRPSRSHECQAFRLFAKKTARLIAETCEQQVVVELSFPGTNGLATSIYGPKTGIVMEDHAQGSQELNWIAAASNAGAVRRQHRISDQAVLLDFSLLACMTVSVCSEKLLEGTATRYCSTGLKIVLPYARV
jgi:hypothetical protein